MGWEVFLARVLPGPLLRAIQLVYARPRPDVRVLSVTPTGAQGPHVSFRTEIANYGTQQCRMAFVARVGDAEIECQPPSLDLIPNDEPKTFDVLAPRPGVGDLVPEFNHETTLYGRALRIQGSAGKHRVVGEWHELVYDRDHESTRYELQQRAWRRGRGDETEQDLRAEWINEYTERLYRGQ